MPTSKRTCQKPEALRGSPSACGPAQIRKCHGASVPHPCTPKRRATSKPTP
jgi:hypothetical protein